MSTDQVEEEQLIKKLASNYFKRRGIAELKRMFRKTQGQCVGVKGQLRCPEVKPVVHPIHPPVIRVHIEVVFTSFRQPMKLLLTGDPGRSAVLGLPPTQKKSSEPSMVQSSCVYPVVVRIPSTDMVTYTRKHRERTYYSEAN